MTLFIINNLPLGARVAPTSVVFASGMAAFCGAGAARFLERLMVLRRSRRVPGDAIPVLVFGAGDGGQRVITSMHTDPQGR